MTKPTTPKTPGAIRLRIRFLFATWGPMTAWPVAARLEYLRLTAALRQMGCVK
jgi:hypothetical protein